MSESDQETKISDQYVLLIQNSINETKELREQMTQKEKASEERIDKLFEKLEDLCENVSTPSTSKRSRKDPKNRVVVPKQCRTDFRGMYKTMIKDPDFKGFDLKESAQSKSNKLAFTRVVEGIHDDYAGRENCPWSTAQLRDACITYFKSLTDAQRRKQSKQAEDHKTICRRQGRMREKLGHRLAALDKTDLSEESKREVREVLTMEYTSSDESERDENSDNEEHMDITKYVVKKLRWQRTRLTTVKSSLDNIHVRSLSKRTMRMRVPRVVGQATSTRSLPENVAEWAVRMPMSSRQALSFRPNTDNSPNSSSVLASSTPGVTQRRPKQ